ncbi:phage holin [Candidatus Fukatsuia symbiotica]|uniref:Lysis protein n=2 Tax=Yersiniaceae TaxID=1903411 RepID=A0A2U8I482_9GAMM|nr:phage holin [Candidatus Fukatsuia symbiotica]AWK13952.1 lysis protein [Candidatus Fukatsuia symbiotica]MEA9445706.1 phage holin [Candidatus Fukatsuia symbiotica]
MTMEKLTTGAAYGVSAGSILNGLLNSYSPEQWNAIGVLAGVSLAAYMKNIIIITSYILKIRYRCRN